MWLSTSLVVFAAIVTGALQTVTVSAIPYNSIESRSSASSSKGFSTGTVNFTNSYQITKRVDIPRPSVDEPNGLKEQLTWLNDWKKYVGNKRAQNPDYKPPEGAPRPELVAWQELQRIEELEKLKAGTLKKGFMHE
ncbi:hypothetical protein BC835DRAFT_676599 [Cytidiella melzeri]|nr:hypothetical protein BC835DRAFT_676599 [Cytidiella melzeri]